MKINSEDYKDFSKSVQDRDFELGTSLSSRIAAAKGECPQPEDIALLVDGELDEADRDKLLGHLASCEKCREVFLAARQIRREEVAKTSRRGWYVISSLAAAAVLVLCVIKIMPVGRQSIVVDKVDTKTIVAAEGGHEPVQQTGAENATPRKDQKSVPVKPMVAASHVDKPFALLTADEAALPAAKIYGFAARERSDGPAIVVESPLQDKAVHDSFNLSIKIEARPGTRVNLETFKFVCLKEQPIDLTSRIKPYLTGKGLLVRNVLIPRGLYNFRVSVADYNGRLTEKEFVVRVAWAL